MTDDAENGRNYLPVAEVARRCGVTVRTVYVWIRARKIEYKYRRGPVRYLVPEDALGPFLPQDYKPKPK